MGHTSIPVHSAKSPAFLQKHSHVTRENNNENTNKEIISIENEMYNHEFRNNGIVKTSEIKRIMENHRV